MRFDELAAVTGGTIYSAPDSTGTFTGVSIDSRTVNPGELFFAIRGEHVDGHRFIGQAVERGASGVVAEFSYPELDSLTGHTAVITVDNTHQAMMDLATRYRRSLDAKFAGITGSNGKTTTKELTYHLLSAVEPTAYRSHGNLNNLFGVPLALFKVPRDCRAAVMEMGISTKVEMPRLAAMVSPDVVAITNVGPTHLEFLSSVEAVAQAKLELVSASRRDVTVILNADDEVLISEAKKVRDRFLTFGLDSPADFTADSYEVNRDGTMTVVIAGSTFRLPLVGRHQVYNLLAAYAVAVSMGYTFDNVDTKSIELSTAPMRGQMIEHDRIRFLVDCYNANPQNVRAGLEGYFSIPGGDRRVVVLGDMLELGRDTELFHRQAGAELAKYSFELAVLVGPLSTEIREGAVEAGVPGERFVHFPDAGAAAREIGDLLLPGDFVYVKGSRGTGLEKIFKDRIEGA